MNENTMNTDQQQETQQGAPTQPEENGGSEKVFTQEDVNRIVSKRLAQDRETRNAAQQQEDEVAAQTADLARRENELACREFIMQGGYKPELLDILPTDNAEDFKAGVAKLIELVPQLDPNTKVPYFPGPTSNAGKFGSTKEDLFASVFKPKF